MPHPPRRKKLLALCVALAALAGHAPAQAPADAPARTLFVTVTDRQGNFVRGLRREDFVVLDGRQRREPASLGAPDAPATVGIMLDATELMRDFWKGGGAGSKGAAMRAALAHFIARGHPENEYFVVAFSREPRLLVEGTSDAREVLAAVERLGEAPGSANKAFYDALHFALERSARGRHAKRVLVALTDGRDKLSRRSLHETYRALDESDALLYVVGLPYVLNDGAGFVAGVVISKMSVTTGGATLLPKETRELLPAFDYLAAELRSQYALGLTLNPSAKRDGWHELEVKLNDLRDGQGKPVKFDVRARRVLYDAPARGANATPRP